MRNEKIKTDAQKALTGLVSPNIIAGSPKTDFEQRVDEILHKFAESPRSVSNQEIEAVVRHKDSQIGNPEGYFLHCVRVGKIFSSAVIQLQKKYEDSLNLPHPEDARAYGTIHDFNATFSDWSKGSQNSKELDLYFIAMARGIDTIANEIALHCDYIGIAKLMADGKPFPKQESYTGMIEILQGDGPLAYKTIEENFSVYLGGKDNLPLLTLTIVDLLENGQETFIPETIDADFTSRFTDDVLVRYTKGDTLQEMKPLGQALLGGGAVRMEKYVKILTDFALGDSRRVREKYADTTFFR
ncbi:MAG: hypothetical protein Q8R37_01595 [Nanoarchaeota archaeon]|nr:hypothetical protein [Nanoarchaeota archaeon]